MKTKNIFYGILLLALSVILFSCGAEKREYRSPSYKSPSDNESSYDRVAGNENKDEASDWETKSFQSPDRKMIYDADITIIVKKPDSASVHVIKIARKYKGYVLNSGSSYTTIRVVSDSLHYAMTEIAALGKVKSKNIYAEDVTDQFTDLSIRLDNSKKAREQYLDLLTKAKTVEETLKVEKELERLNTEIDLLEGKMNKLNHLQQYSTITVNIQKNIKPGPIGFVFKYLYKGVKFLFIWN